MLENWTKESFQQSMHSCFEIDVPGQGRQNLELVELTDYPSSAAVVAFSAIFRGPRELPFGQGSYAIFHPGMGQADLFLVPIGREADGMRYEAVFNRLVKS